LVTLPFAVLFSGRAMAARTGRCCEHRTDLGRRSRPFREHGCITENVACANDRGRIEQLTHLAPSLLQQRLFQSLRLGRARCMTG
jgi:hypothetical protein